MNHYKNPIIEGFSPDPSVCAVGDDYYLVTSTFAYFPGVPIYHSKDLVHWTQIGNILNRKEQLPLQNAEHSQGIFAPSIRYHNGVFYMTTTNVTNGGNFYVTATNPAGPWSDPYYLKNAVGIDPSLFFDDNGKCYYVGTRPNPKGVTYNGDWEVWLQELDLNTHQLIGVSTSLWKGALRDVIWPEGPHIYKKEGYYYLMIAEGGTGFNHAITIARSESVDGPYIGNKNNPILTHRHLGKDFPVINVGHGDLVETPDGKWFMTCLASRVFEGYSNLGRETFLAEVVWEDGWPVINPGEGRLLEKAPHSLPLRSIDHQDSIQLSPKNPAFLYLRNPNLAYYQWNEANQSLRLIPSITKLHDIKSPTYIGIRQKSMNYTFQVELTPKINTADIGGIVILQNNLYYIQLTVEKADEHYVIKMASVFNGDTTILASQVVHALAMTLIFDGEGQQLSAKAIVDGQEIIIAKKVDTHFLSTEIAGGFVGCTLGVFATTENNQTDSYLEVKSINYQMKD